MFYKNDSVKLENAEYQYMYLDSKDAQKEICDNFFKYKHMVDYEYGTHAYTTGMIDAFRIILVLLRKKREFEKLEILNSLTIRE